MRKHNFIVTNKRMRQNDGAKRIELLASYDTFLCIQWSIAGPHASDARRLTQMIQQAENSS
jgi:hypothetical protein